MLRICIKPTTFDVYNFQDEQNKYINPAIKINKKKVFEQHANLEKTFTNMITYTIQPGTELLPDIVFIANGGVCLPRVPTPILILPYMKYPQRKNELEYLKQIYHNLNIHTIQFPGDDSAPFEGQAEIKWFYNGNLAICGYGFRSTKKSFEILGKLLNKIYRSFKLQPPKLLIVPLKSKDYYHLDVAMLEFDNTKCIIHKNAFSVESTQKIKNFLGEENVFVIDTDDSFCLNAVVDGPNLMTHRLKTKALKTELETITGKKIKEIDTSEFEKSGGSVRCMTLDIF
jgi:N-dimethylarginine dimethylaminohydrolase